MGPIQELEAIPGLRVDPAAPTPVYRQIADSIRSALREGRLAPGFRLPPSRDLARHLGVNRNTVVAAYDALASAGVVESHTGRGTFLAHAAPLPGRAPEAPPGATAAAWSPPFSRAVEGSRVAALLSIYRLVTASGGISFAGSYPAADLLPVDEFRRSMAATLRDRGSEVLGYGPTAGHAPLREMIAAGGYTLAYLSDEPAIVGILGCFGVVVALTLVLERVAFRPLRGTSPATMLVATFAISFLMQPFAKG